VSPPAALVALLYAQAAGVAAAPPVLPRPRIEAVRTTERPVIDGKLDDRAWRTAPPSDTFTQHFPDEGAPPSERTELRILYDDQNLYIGVDCQQVLSPVVRRLMRRDTPLPSDGVWLDIDSRRDGVSAFHFSVNAAGVLSDAIHFNDTDYSSDWDAVWEAKVADTGHGYSIEFRIPLSVLRFSALPVQDWGLQVRRFIDARQETDDWAFYPRTAASYVPLFGRLVGLVGLKPRHPLELRPFALGRLRHRAADVSTSTLAQGNDASASVGVDAKAHVTNELTLDLTANPDFGQVEADTVVLNLSTFETVFPEKRPFFLEGIDAFSAIRPLVYTRRIGRQPVTPVVGPGETLVDEPEPSPIYGAAKLVGTIGGRTTVGLLSAVTGRNDVQVQAVDPATGATTRAARAADVLTAYNIVRLKRLVARNAELGLLATAANRLEPGLLPGRLCPTTRLAPAADGRCTNDAYVASVDGRWRSPSGNYAASAQAVVTTLAHGPARAQRDGIAVQPGTPSGSGAFYVGKEGGAHWLAGASQFLSGRQLEFNDVGYLERKNDYQGYFNLTYRSVAPWWRTLETRTMLQLNTRDTLDGINLWKSVELQTWWTLANFWGVYADVHGVGARFDDREMGDGAALERSARLGAEVSVNSDPRRLVMASAFAQVQHLSNGAHYEAHGQATFRLLPQLELGIIPTWTYDRGEPRYLSTRFDSSTPGVGQPPAYLFGAQAASSLGATLRGAYTFTPELSLQLYAQVFLSRVHYTAFYEHVATAYRGRVYLDDLLPSAPPASNPDTQTATLNVNAVLRWEYRLGSTLFVVYTRAQAPSLTLPVGGAAGLDLQPVLHGRAAVDVLMVKLAYWWG
jgi:hypothetical protein